MNLLNQSAFLKALGWSLLNSLWQIGLLWLLYTLLTANQKKFQSRQKHTLALLSLLAGNAWFIISLVTNYYKALESPDILYLTANEYLTATGFTQWAQVFEPFLPYLSSLYLVTIIFLFIRFYTQYRFTQKITMGGLFKVNPQLRVFVKEVAQQLGIKKEIRTWLSDKIDTPLTIGFWKPIILLPVAAMSHLSMEQAEAILLHELQHIRRNDFIINILIAVTDIILFFNPFARLLSGTLRKERENSCDDMVLQFKYNASAYAKALLLLEQNRITKPVLALAATGGKNKQVLLNRIKRILQCKTDTAPVNYKLMGFLLSALLIGSISWMNPGKMIVQRIENTIEIKSVTDSKENPLVFTSRAMHDRKSKTITAKIKQQVVKEINDNENKAFLAAADNMIQVVSDQNSDEPAENTVTFATTEKPVEFSIIESDAPATAATASANNEPYIPSSSFSYQLVQDTDTTKPKKYILNYSQLKAKEEMEKTLKVLEEINWPKLQEQLKQSGSAVDVVKLQEELRKAVQDVDWKKINEDAVAGIQDAQNELKQQTYLLQLQKFQQDRKEKQEKNKVLQNIIVEDRVNECLQKSESEKRKHAEPVVQKIKKIVVI